MGESMSRLKLAVIGTFHKRFESSTDAIRRVLYGTRAPDEFWIMCEDDEDAANASRAYVEVPAKTKVIVQTIPTKRDEEGTALYIPYSRKINTALDQTDADLIAHLDNASTPHKYKYELMAAMLEQHPEYGAVYCAQQRTGFHNTTSWAEEIVPDAFCRLNYTQVMHRRTADRWTEDMVHANPDLADALFWRALHVTLGPFYPVNTEFPLDLHHIPSPAALDL